MAVQLTKGDCIGTLFVSVIIAAFKAWDLHTAAVALGVI